MNKTASAGTGRALASLQSRVEIQAICRESRDPEHRSNAVASVGGIFHQRSDAQQVADALVLAGVEPESIRFEVLPRSVADVLGLLGIPPEAVRQYERHVVPGDIFLVVTSDALPANAIANEIARAGGMVVELGHTPTSRIGDR